MLVLSMKNVIIIILYLRNPIKEVDVGLAMVWKVCHLTWLMQTYYHLARIGTCPQQGATCQTHHLITY